jgi:hypothetical protein
LSKDETLELLAEVLHHVVSLRFSVDQKIQRNLLLETDYNFNLLLDELFIFYLCKLAFAQFGTGLTNLLGLLWTTISVVVVKLD